MPCSYREYVWFDVVIVAGVSEGESRWVCESCDVNRKLLGTSIFSFIIEIIPYKTKFSIRTVYIPCTRVTIGEYKSIGTSIASQAEIQEADSQTQGVQTVRVAGDVPPWTEQFIRVAPWPDRGGARRAPALRRRLRP